MSSPRCSCVEAMSDSVSIRYVRYEISFVGISTAVLAKLETTPIDTTLVSIEIAVRKFTVSLTGCWYALQLCWYSGNIKPT